MRMIVLLMLMGACGSNALDLSNDEQAMRLVWEGQYGMERESRPRLEWFDGCRTKTDASQTQIASTTYAGGCIVSIVHNDGRIEIARAQTISQSHFAFALRQWKQWLTLTDMVPHWDSAEIDAANAVLISNGL